MAYRNSQNETGIGITATATKPAGTLDGDIVIAHVMSERSGTTIAPPGDWTLVETDANPSDFSVWTYWLKADSGDPASWDWEFGGSHGVGDDWAIQTASYSGRDGDDPINVSDANIGAGINTLTSPSITPTVDGCDLVGFWSVDASGTSRTWAVESPLTERGEFNDNSLQAVLGDLNQAAKAAIDKDGTVSGNIQDMTCHWMALAPEEVGGEEVIGAVVEMGVDIQVSPARVIAY